ncbi:hypothetical protein LTS17_004688 [Exophiala oligosperma]
MVPSAVQGDGSVTRGRQLPGAACDECRRRKLQCDRQKPRCGVCQESRTMCEVTQRGVRGPKRGHLRALKDRILHLETMLATRQGGQQQQLDDAPVYSPEFSRSEPGMEEDMAERGSEVDDISAPFSLPGGVASAYDPSAFLAPPSLTGSSREQDKSMSPEIGGLSGNHLHIPEVMRDELDQLYWDRVHPSIPILQQRRYLSWTKFGLKSSAQMCLQSAMWMLATLLSVQIRNLTDALYRQTKQMLVSQNFETDHKDGGCDTEIVQAWLLVAIYESMRASHKQAWMSAGRVYRLVQGFRFHELDKTGTIIEHEDSNDIVKREEQRRLFWMAYLLDHLMSLRNDWPITLNEHMICTRLPGPDADFQSGRPVSGSFLSEAITESSPRFTSPFTESIVLTTLYGRSLLRSQQHSILSVYGDGGDSDWLAWHRWLDNTLKIRLQVVARLCALSQTAASDPFLLFTNILGHGAVVYLCKCAMQSAASLARQPDVYAEVLQCQARALAAATAVVRLASELRELHFSKIYPLMPIPLFVVAEFLYENLTDVGPNQQLIGELLNVFRDLKNINNLEQCYLDLLPRSCVSRTTALLSYTSSSAD